MAELTAALRLFDADWYCATYPDLGNLSAYEHFQSIGAAKGHDPNPLFSTRWYLSRYPEVAAAGHEALEDFVIRGVQLGRDPGPLFSTRWYSQRVPGLTASGENPLVHYIERGFAQLCDPSPLFDSAWYFATYPDAAGKGLDALLHFMDRGASLGYSPSTHFDVKWYLDAYPEVAASETNPLLHYLLEGAARGFDPGPGFSTREYLGSHPSLRLSGENPLVHHLLRTPARCHQNGSRYAGPSHEAIAEVRSLIEALSAVEPDLLALPEDLAGLQVSDIKPGPADQAWRRLYLSIHELPSAVILVASIDDTPELAAILDRTAGILVVETDARTLSVADSLPFGTEWRAFSEFHPVISDEDRLRLTTALINGLQPETVVVWGSRSGWEMIANHGKAISRHSTIIASDTIVAGMDLDSMMLKYYRNLMPFLSNIYSNDPVHLAKSAEFFGISRKDRAKIGPTAKVSAMKIRPLFDAGR